MGNNLQANNPNLGKSGKGVKIIKVRKKFRVEKPEIFIWDFCV